MAPRKPRAPKAEAPENKSSPFLEALKFVSLVTKDTGSINETHVSLANNCAVAFNGVLAAGIRVNDGIYCCPHNKLLIQALSKCGDNVSITQINNRLSIKSGKFKAVVPCVDPSSMSPASPDMPIAPINDIFKEALSAVGVLTIEDRTSVITNSILMNGKSLIASDRKVIFEYWHGCDLPPGLALPKSLIQSLTKCTKKLVSFGFSKSSATFWFEDDCWLRTQLYAEAWPDLRGILDKPSNPWPTPPDLFKALHAIAPFSEDGQVYFDAAVLKTHAAEGVGATHEVHGLPAGPVFSIKQLALLEKHALKIDFVAPGPSEGTTMLKFFGNNIRGCIAGRS